ncbi:MAG: hypothetical protein IPL65_07390 [Lewinellaceae bacterium]|nr:hypothetical protein [Lewinellaceae bacterium]
MSLPSDPDFLQSKDWDKQLDYLNTLKPMGERQWTLMDPGDFNSHSTEIKLDALPAGAYAVLVSDNKAFDKLKGYAGFTTFTASKIVAATRLYSSMAMRFGRYIGTKACPCKA